MESNDEKTALLINNDADVCKQSASNRVPGVTPTKQKSVKKDVYISSINYLGFAIITLVVGCSTELGSAKVIPQYIYQRLQNSIDNYTSIPGSVIGSNISESNSNGCGNVSNENNLQHDASFWMMYFKLTEDGTELFSLSVFGVSSDFIGRKPLIILTLLGITLRYGGIAFIIYMNLDIGFLFIPYGIAGLIGNSSVFYVAIFSIIADTTKRDNTRTIYMTLFDFVHGIAVSGSQIGAGYLFKLMGYLFPLLLATGICFIAILPGLLLIPETVKRETNSFSFTNAGKNFISFYRDKTVFHSASATGVMSVSPIPISKAVLSRMVHENKQESPIFTEPGALFANLYVVDGICKLSSSSIFSSFYAETQDFMRERKFPYYLLAFVVVLFACAEDLQSKVVTLYLYEVLEEGNGNKSNGKNNSTLSNQCASSNKSTTSENSVQAEASHWSLYFSLLENGITIILMFISGVYSDVVGRKPFMLLSLFGTCVKFVTTALFVYKRYQIRLLFIIYAIGGIAGGYSIFAICCLAIIADVTKRSKSRTLGLALFDVFIGVGLSGTEIASGYLVQKTGYIWPCVIAASICLVCAMTYIIFIPETAKLSPTQRQTLKTTVSDLVKFYYSDKHLYEEKNWPFILSMAILMIVWLAYGASISTLYELGSPFCWTPEDIGWFSSLTIVSHLVIGVALIRVPYLPIYVLWKLCALYSVLRYLTTFMQPLSISGADLLLLSRPDFTLSSEFTSTSVATTDADRTQIYGVDENEERGNWTGRMDFLLSMLGYCVGLGNVWRFPYMCYRNGGGAFLVPFIIMMAVVGVPLFYLETSLGCGPTTCWGFAPLFKGLGVAMLVVSALVSIYYNVIITWSMFYFFASFTGDLPWGSCDNSWNTRDCSLKLPIVNCTKIMGVKYQNGTCYQNDIFRGLWNSTLFTNATGRKRMYASEEYWNYHHHHLYYYYYYYYSYIFSNHVLGLSSGIDDIGTPRWQLALTLLLAWVVCFLCLLKGIKTSGKVVYFTAVFPYVVLLILFFRGVTLANASEGIYFYIVPKFERLLDAKVNDIVTSYLRKTTCSALTVKIEKRFHHRGLGRCLNEHIWRVRYIFLPWLYGGRDECQGAGLAFVVYPEAMNRLPLPTLWSILFFFMLITLGVDSQFVMLESVLTGMVDYYPFLRKKKSYVIMLICLVFFLLGIPLSTPGGMYLVQLMDHYVASWSLLIIGLIEVLVISYVYGINRFYKDMSFILLFAWIDYSPAKYDEYTYPVWADVLGWMMSFCSIIWIPIVMLYKINKEDEAKHLLDKLKLLITPTREWGPALIKHRRLIDYVDGFVVDPYEEKKNLSYVNYGYANSSNSMQRVSNNTGERERQRQSHKNGS
ncbi:hypothetical protein KUTeg_020416 [Tegillarca granosa]|uniref:Transporter n=1 Tax=Tegillarca granosa TaxID=220873 RepID=A0ABQ9E7T7_TEGGR|nr:hypothetical protein KUTeg_020416 [Tegillarca granosa]